MKSFLIKSRVLFLGCNFIISNSGILIYSNLLFKRDYKLSKIRIGRRLSAALINSIVGRYAVYFTQLISMIVLARTFSPEIFGLVAVMQVFALFFTLFSEMGLGPALINEKKVGPSLRDSVFSATILFGIGICVVFILLAPLIAAYYENIIYKTLCIPIGLSIVFSSASIVPLSSLQKQTKFIVIARVESISEILSLISVFLLLLIVEPVWALIFKYLISSFFKFILFWYESINTDTGRAKLGYQFYKIKPLLGFSFYQAGFNFLNFFSRNMDNILVGKYFGLASLGIYDKAYQLMRYPLMLLTFAMTPAIQPVLTEIKNNKLEFERLHNKFVKYISFLGVIIGVAVYLLAEYIVLILLGEQWIEVKRLLEILCITIPIQIVLSSSGGFYQAAGRTDLLFKCGVFSSIVNVSAICWGIYLDSLESLCWALVCSFSINFFQCYYIMGKNLFPQGYGGIFKSMSISILLVLFFSLLILKL